MITLEITGLGKIAGKIAPERLDRAMDLAVDRAAQVLRDETKRLPAVSAARTGYGAKGVPVDTGRMRQSLRVRKLRMLAADVYTGVKYGGYVHSGTSRMPARPFFLWALRDFGAKAKIARMVNETLSRLLK